MKKDNSIKNKMKEIFIKMEKENESLKNENDLLRKRIIELEEKKQNDEHIENNKENGKKDRLDEEKYREMEKMLNKLRHENTHMKKEYFQFLFEFLHHVPFPTNMNYNNDINDIMNNESKKGDIGFKTIVMLTIYVFEVMVNSKIKTQYEEWINLLVKLYSGHLDACVWFLDMLSGTKKDIWVKIYLFKTEEKWIREGFSKLIINVLDTISPHEYHLYPKEVNEEDDMLLFEELRKRKYTRVYCENCKNLGHHLTNESSENESECKEKNVSGNKKRAISVVFINYLLSMLEYSRRYWEHFKQYFQIIHHYGSKGQPEKLHLATCVIPSLTTPMRFVSLWFDWYMGQFSPKIRKTKLEVLRVKIGNIRQGESARLVEFFRCLEGALLVTKTDSKTNPPTLLGDSNVEMDEESKSFLFNQEMFVSLLKQAYDLSSNCMIIRHWSFENAEKSHWFLSVASSALKSCIDEPKKKHALHVCLVVKDICDIKDSFQQYRVSLTFNPDLKSNSIFSTIKRFSQISGHSDGVIKCLGILSLLIGNGITEGNISVSNYLYKYKEEWQEWIFPYLNNNINIPMAEKCLSKWKSLYEGKITQEIDWNSNSEYRDLKKKLHLI